MRAAAPGDSFADALSLGRDVGRAVGRRAASRARRPGDVERVGEQWLRVLALHPAEAAGLPGGADLTRHAGAREWAAVEAGYRLGVLDVALSSPGRAGWGAAAAERAGYAAGYAVASAAPWDVGRPAGAAASASLAAVLDAAASPSRRTAVGAAASAGFLAEALRGAAAGVAAACAHRAPALRAHLSLARRPQGPRGPHSPNCSTSSRASSRL